jgi:hypothetical protein
LLALQPPAFAQADFTGTWGAYQEDFPAHSSPDLGDYLGLPINASARQFADSWDPSGSRCRKSSAGCTSPVYLPRPAESPHLGRSTDTQELVAIKHHISTYDQTRTIYMDGRPHPPRSRHTEGFSTGKWLGDMLMVNTRTSSRGGFAGMACR